MLYVTLRQYEFVVAVAETGSLTEAAQRLNVSQPSLSAAITLVEDRLGNHIFRRRRGAAIEITPFGHRFTKRASALLREARRLEDVGTETGRFGLGCFQDIAPWHLAPALETLRNALPETTIFGMEGRFADLSEGLATGTIDLAISYDIGFGKNFEHQTLCRVAPVAFLPVGHPLAGRDALELEDLLPHKLILFAEPGSQSFMQDLFKRLGLSPEISHRVSSLELMRSLAAHGEGVGLSYTSPPAKITYDGKALASVPIATRAAETEIKLIWSSLRNRDELFEQALKLLSSA